MVDEVLGDQIETGISTHDRFDPSPARLRSLGLGELMTLGDLLDVLVDLGLRLGRQRHLGQSRLVENAHGGAILDRTGEVIDVDVLAEHSPGRLVRCVYRRAGEP